MSSQNSPHSANVSLGELHTMRLRVDYLNKQQQRFRKNLNGSYEFLLKAIDNKLNHQQKQHLKLSRQRTLQTEKQLNHEKVLLMRQRQQQQLKNIKISYFALKKQQTAEIKEMQKRERIVALQRQEQEANRKRELAEKIKSSHQQVKVLNEQRLLEKKKESVEVMKKTRARARYPSTALQEMTVLQERAKSLATSLSSSQMYDKSVEQLAQQTNKMNLEDFHRILKDMKLSVKNREEARKKVAQALLKQKKLDGLFMV